MTSTSFLRRLSLRSKLLLLLILIPLLMLSSYLALVVRTFETDKVGFVFESSANLSRSVGAQVRSDLAMVIATLQPVLQDYLENKT